MSQRNSETDAMAIGMAFVGIACFILMFALYAVACFAAIVFTILALWAWDEDKTIGSWTITREEARTFIYGGIVGLVALPVFIIFCAALLKANIQESWWGYILLGGYSFGALGFSAAIAEEEKKKEATAFLTIEHTADAENRPPQGLPAPEAKPFRFASWDDEENGK